MKHELDSTSRDRGLMRSASCRAAVAIEATGGKNFTPAMYEMVPGMVDSSSGKGARRAALFQQPQEAPFWCLADYRAGSGVGKLSLLAVCTRSVTRRCSKIDTRRVGPGLLL